MRRERNNFYECKTEMSEGLDRLFSDQQWSWRERERPLKDVKKEGLSRKVSDSCYLQYSFVIILQKHIDEHVL